MRTLINVLLFYGAWFACVLGAARGQPSIGVFVVAALAVIHTTLIHRQRPQALVLALSGLIGCAFDTVLLQTDMIRFSGHPAGSLLAPAWMTALWVAFATLLGVSLRWLRERELLATVLGAAGGPASYYAGQRLGAIQLADPIRTSLVVVAVEWAIAMPLLCRLSRRLDRPTHSGPAV